MDITGTITEMKITKTQLKQLIKEELASVTENTGPMLSVAVGDEIEGLIGRVTKTYNTTADEVIAAIQDNILTPAQKEALANMAAEPDKDKESPDDIVARYPDPEGKNPDQVIYRWQQDEFDEHQAAWKDFMKRNKK